jgi:hypothetical protein
MKNTLALLTRNTALAGFAAVFSGVCMPAVAAPCTEDGLDTYLSGGANAKCTVLNVTISGVMADPVFAPDVLVIPQTTANNPGLFFDVSPVPGIGITFTVTAPSRAPITDASLSTTGFVDNNDAFHLVDETLSNGSSLFITGTTPVSVSFASTTSLTVTNVGNGNEEQVTFQSFINQFSLTPTAVPEPGTWALMALGFAGLGFAGWRSRRGSVSIAA